jgi:protease-4
LAERVKSRFLRGFLAFLILSLALGAADYWWLLHTGRLGKGKAIGLITLKGVIDDQKGEDIVSLLEEGRKDSRIGAILLRIESPGGMVAPSQEIYEEILRVRAGGKKVIASIGSVGASGGYYAASACDKIFADGGTLTGSIGVIFSVSNLQELMKKVGVRQVVLKSGKFKDVGSPFRDLTPEDKKLIMAMIDDIYNQFVEDVAKERKLPVEKVKEYADGRVMTGRQALKAGLIDGLKGEIAVVEYLSKDLGVVGEARVIRLKKEIGFWERVSQMKGELQQIAESIRNITKLTRVEEVKVQ